MMSAQHRPYWKKLTDPRWQKLRLEIFQRDAFTCQECQATDKELQVHHHCYLAHREPWEYPKWFLVTLCVDCHKDNDYSPVENFLEVSDMLRDFCGLSPLDAIDFMIWRSSLNCDHRVEVERFKEYKARISTPFENLVTAEGISAL